MHKSESRLLSNIIYSFIHCCIQLYSIKQLTSAIIDLARGRITFYKIQKNNHG